MEEISYMFLFIILTAAHFHISDPDSISYFENRRYKIFMLFFQQKNVSFVFYRSL